MLGFQVVYNLQLTLSIKYVQEPPECPPSLSQCCLPVAVINRWLPTCLVTLVFVSCWFQKDWFMRHIDPKYTEWCLPQAQVVFSYRFLCFILFAKKGIITQTGVDSIFCMLSAEATTYAVYCLGLKLQNESTIAFVPVPFPLSPLHCPSCRFMSRFMFGVLPGCDYSKERETEFKKAIWRDTKHELCVAMCAHAW